MVFPKFFFRIVYKYDILSIIKILNFLYIFSDKLIFCFRTKFNLLRIDVEENRQNICVEIEPELEASGGSRNASMCSQNSVTEDRKCSLFRSYIRWRGWTIRSGHSKPFFWRKGNVCWRKSHKKNTICLSQWGPWQFFLK